MNRIFFSSFIWKQQEEFYCMLSIRLILIFKKKNNNMKKKKINSIYQYISLHYHIQTIETKGWKYVKKIIMSFLMLISINLIIYIAIFFNLGNHFNISK
jgi:hypothetical protein